MARTRYTRRYCHYCGATLNSITHEYLVCGDCGHEQDNAPYPPGAQYDPYTGEFIGDNPADDGWK